MPSAAQVVPVGAEFQISVYTVSTQRSVEVATDGAGNIVAVWHSYDQDHDATGIFGRRFDSSGNPLGAEFQVSSYTLGYQYNPTVAAAAAGNFVVAWGSSANYGIPGQVSQDGHYSGIFAQRFGSDGMRQGSEFQVNSQIVSYQENPEIAIDAGGGFAGRSWTRSSDTSALSEKPDQHSWQPRLVWTPRLAGAMVRACFSRCRGACPVRPSVARPGERWPVTARHGATRSRERSTQCERRRNRCRAARSPPAFSWRCSRS